MIPSDFLDNSIFDPLLIKIFRDASQIETSAGSIQSYTCNKTVFIFE